ncbi:MAG: hypothetical protein U1E86_28405 [Burkholderiaceae bacterium]
MTDTVALMRRIASSVQVRSGEAANRVAAEQEREVDVVPRRGLEERSVSKPSPAARGCRTPRRGGARTRS